MDKRPVGIFDSGLGGLTAVRALRELLPNEDIIYFADSARVPYGAKTPSQLRRIAKQDMDLLSSYGVKAILAACGTVSSNTGDIIESYHVPAMGVINSVVKVMGEIPGRRALGIIATDASIKSGSPDEFSAVAAKLLGTSDFPSPEHVPVMEV